MLAPLLLRAIPPEANIGYELTSMGCDGHDSISGRILNMDLWRSPGTSKRCQTLQYTRQRVTACVSTRIAAWNGYLVALPIADVGIACSGCEPCSSMGPIVNEKGHCL